MLLLVFFFLGVFLLYIERERCARQRKFILLVVKTEREKEKKFTNFATTHQILWFWCAFSREERRYHRDANLYSVRSLQKYARE